MAIKKFQSIFLKVVSALLLLLGVVFFLTEKKDNALFRNSTRDINSAIPEGGEDVSPLESAFKDMTPSQAKPSVSNEASGRNKTFPLYHEKNKRQAPPVDSVEFEKWAAGNLRTRFGDNIRSKGRQAELLGFRTYMMKRYPQDWQPRLYNILSSAFPEYADTIYETFAEFDTYNQWFEDNAAFLGSLEYSTIKLQLNQKRSEIFGEAAAEIWPSESKTLLVKDVFAILNHIEDIPIEDQFYVFKKAVDDAYPPDDEDNVSSDIIGLFADLKQNRINDLTAAFIGTGSVQKELSNMEAAERIESLYQIRKQMGFDDAALEKMAVKDRENEQKWQNGSKYMAHREELIEEFSGVELDAQLEDLRQQFFKDEAQTIAAEEASNFFRFNRRRIYGRN